MKNYREAIMHLLRDDSGQDLIEYALIAGLIGLGAVTLLNTLTGTLSTVFSSIGTQLTNAT
jgi:pilus assembly protein Flp/PilA